MTNLHFRSLGALALGGLLAACGGANDSASTDAAPSVTASGGPSAIASGAPSDGAGASAAPGASAGGEATTPDGWQRLTVADHGFSIAVPEEWATLSAEDLGEADVFAALIEANPDAAAALEQAQTAIENGQIGLAAFDTQSSGTFATNVNVINVGPVTETAEEAAEQIAAGIEQQVPVNGEIETSTTTLPAGEAAIIEYEWTVADNAGGEVDVRVVQYAIIGEDAGYVLSMSAAVDAFADYQDTFRQIAESFVEETP